LIEHTTTLLLLEIVYSQQIIQIKETAVEKLAKTVDLKEGEQKSGV